MKLDQQACGIVVFSNCGTSRVRAGRLVKQLQVMGYKKGYVFDFRGVWRLVDGKQLTLQFVWWGSPTPASFFQDAAYVFDWGKCEVYEPGDGSSFL